MTNDKGILIQNIYYMLSYAFQELRQNNYSDVGSEEFANIYDLFAEILARGIASQLKHGLHREYITHREALMTLKGKLDFGGTLRNRMQRKLELSCMHDDLSVNCVFNQILKTTLQFLIFHREVKTERRKALKKLQTFFIDVDAVDVKGIKWNTLRFDRNTRSYRMLLCLCYFVLNSLLLTTTEGNVRMRAFTDEHLHRLFEKFILEYYSKEHCEWQPAARKINWNIIEEQSTTDILPAMQTDVVLTMPDRTLIIDAKYYRSSMQKYYDKHTIHSANIYQIQSYVCNLDIQHTGKVDGMLLYAQTEEDSLPHGQIRLRDGNNIYFRAIDLNQKFDNIKRQLEEFVK